MTGQNSRTAQERRNEAWEQKFALLEQYLAEFGSFPPQDCVYHGVKLGIWVCNQRRRNTNTRRCAERTEKLRRIGLLEFSPHADRWERNYTLTLEYIDSYGRLPAYDCVYQGFRLGLWCMNQRTKCRKPDYPTEQLARLEAIGLTKLPTRKSLWEDNLDLLREYKEPYGTLPPSRCVYKGIRLGSWCSRNKAQAKHPDYPPERRQALQQIGLL